MIYKDKLAINDTEDCPSERGNELCLNCNRFWSNHAGWRCSGLYQIASTEFSLLQPDQRYYTKSMRDSIISSPKEMYGVIVGFPKPEWEGKANESNIGFWILESSHSAIQLFSTLDLAEMHARNLTQKSNVWTFLPWKYDGSERVEAAAITASLSSPNVKSVSTEETSEWRKWRDVLLTDEMCCGGAAMKKTCIYHGGKQ